MINSLKVILKRILPSAGRLPKVRSFRRASFLTMLLTLLIFTAVLAADETSGTILLSTGGADAEGKSIYGNDFSGYVTASADGRFIVFDSRAGNILGANWTHAVCGQDEQYHDIPCYDIFLYDKTLDIHFLISRNYNNYAVPANGDSRFPVMSRDGRFIVFQSNAYNLLPPGEDSNDFSDVFIFDVACIDAGYNTYFTEDAEYGTNYGCGEIGLINQSIGLVSRRDIQLDQEFSPDANSGNPSIAPYPRYGLYINQVLKSPVVIFESQASNLVADDSNGHKDIFERKFVRDIDNGELNDVYCLTCKVAGTSTDTNGDSYSPVISDSGNWLAFVSNASNWVSGDTNNKKDVYLLNRDPGYPPSSTPTVALISKNPSSGVVGNGNSDFPTLSKDGIKIAFQSDASNLVSGDGSPNYYDIFLFDQGKSPPLSRQSKDSMGVTANNNSFNPNLSANGSALAFTSYADNLVEGDNNVDCHQSVDGHEVLINCPDIFVRDVALGETWRASITSNGLQAQYDSAVPFLAGENETGSGGHNNEGKYIFFSSRAELDDLGIYTPFQQVFYRNQGTPAGNPSIQPTYWTFYGYINIGTSKRFTLKFLGPLDINGAISVIPTDGHTNHFQIINNECTIGSYAEPENLNDPPLPSICTFDVKYVPTSTADHDFGRVTIPIDDDRGSINIAVEGYGRIFEYMPLIVQEGY